MSNLQENDEGPAMCRDASLGSISSLPLKDLSIILADRKA